MKRFYLLLLAATGVHAQLPPVNTTNTPTLVTKAQYIACLDEQEIITLQRDDFDERMKAHRAEISRIRVAQTTLITEREKLDMADPAAANLFNQKSELLNARALRANQNGDFLEQAELRLNRNMDGLKAVCGNIAVGRTDKEAAIAERAARSNKK